MRAVLNPTYKARYADIYHGVFKPLKAECERVYDEQNPTGYMNHAGRDTAINAMVFEELQKPYEHQKASTKEAITVIGRANFIAREEMMAHLQGFVADVKENGLTAVVMALPKDNRITKSGVAAPQPVAAAALPKEGGEKPIHPLSVSQINPDLIAQFKAAQAIRA